MLYHVLNFGNLASGDPSIVPCLCSIYGCNPRFTTLPNDLTRKSPVSNQKITAGSTANSLSSAAQRPNRAHDDLRLLINSRTPIITVETTEEDRLKDLLLTI